MNHKAEQHWTICLDCQGRGKKSKRIRKKAKLQYQRELAAFISTPEQCVEPVKPKGHLDNCPKCQGSGLIYSTEKAEINTELYPHVSIIGAGIGGVALAVACLHRGIPFTLFERDDCFDARSQGYGLTLQQASRAIEGFGIFSLQDKVISTRHVVHTPDGKEIGEWGNRKWVGSDLNTKKSSKRTNIHIARQSLRMALLKQLGDQETVKWNHQFLSFDENEKVLTFKVNKDIIKLQTDLVVGADGIRSSVRKQMIGEAASPLSYLGCIVILGICPLSDLTHVDSPLLDSATVFQTANGHERIYIMPYDKNSVMWQLSFPMTESAAKTLSAKGPAALKEEAIQRCQWHQPIPQILTATQSDKISGYPVYDRELIDASLLANNDQVTLIGDAAHPMSPFKGQGANQALLDALSLARTITKQCRPQSGWREVGIRESVLNEFESEMLARSAVKVKDSAEAAKFLHSDVVLHESNEPRGRCLQSTK